MNTSVMLSYAMIALLVLVALLCFVSKGSEQWLPGNRKYIMGFVLLAYSLIRFIRLRRFIKMNSHEN